MAQTPAVRATPSTNPQSNQSNWNTLRNMSREERMRQNRERIQRILNEDRERKEAERKKQQEAQKAAAPAAGQPGQAPAPGPGQPVPTGPMQQYVPNQQVLSTTSTAAKPSKPEQARDNSRSLLYLLPMDSMCNVGDTFETDIVADTQSGSTDDIRFLLCYPPNKLNPLAIDFAPVADKAQNDDISYSCDNQIGELWMRVPFKNAVVLSSVPVVTITWEALAPTEAGQLRFGFVEGHEEASTGMYLNGEYILGTEHDHQCGALDGSVVIRDRKRKDYLQKIGYRDVIISSTDYVMPPATMDIYLDSVGRTFASVGDEFTIEVCLSNPFSRQFDSIQAYLQYDPSVLKVLDTDANNWIREGINGADAFAHSIFPFDYFRKNHADNNVGDFIYDAVIASTPVRSSGPFLKITFKALKATKGTDIVLVKNNPGFAPTTDVSYLKTSMLKTDSNGASVLHGITLRIDPDSSGNTVVTDTGDKKPFNKATRRVIGSRGKRIY